MLVGIIYIIQLHELINNKQCINHDCPYITNNLIFIGLSFSGGNISKENFLAGKFAQMATLLNYEKIEEKGCLFSL